MPRDLSTCPLDMSLGFKSGQYCSLSIAPGRPLAALSSSCTLGLLAESMEPMEPIA